MNRVRKTVSIILVLLMTVFALAACGSGGSGDSGSGADVSVDSIKTIGDVYALEKESEQSAVYDGKVVCAFKVGDTYYRVRADISDEDMQKYMDIEFDDEDYEKKQHAIIDKLEIKEKEELNDQILSQDDLDALAGKTGQELVDEGWSYQGSYNLETMEVWMDYGPFEYSVIFNSDTPLENSDDFDIEAATADLTVESAEFFSLGDATNVE